MPQTNLNDWRKELEFATDDLCNHDDGHEDYCIYSIVVPIVEKALSRHDKERTAEVKHLEEILNAFRNRIIGLETVIAGQEKMIEALKSYPAEVEKLYEDIAVFTERLDTKIMNGEIMEGFKDEEEMRKAIDYGVIEMRILDKVLTTLRSPEGEEGRI